MTDSPTSTLETIHQTEDPNIDLKTFKSEVMDKIEEMDGLLTEQAAATLVIHDYQPDHPVRTIDELTNPKQKATVEGRITHIGEVRSFEKSDSPETGHVCNIRIADSTGTITANCWDDQAKQIPTDYNESEPVQINGQTTYNDYSDAIELNVDTIAKVDNSDIESPDVADSEATISIQSIKDTSPATTTVTGVVLDVEEPRTFTNNGKQHQVASAVIGDETGHICVTFWRDQTELVSQLDTGNSYTFSEFNTNSKKGVTKLHSQSTSSVQKKDADIEFNPKNTNIEHLEIGDEVTVSGHISNSYDPNRFEKSDGTEGVVRNIRISDETGSLRLALWGDLAEQSLDENSSIVITDVEIEEGHSDDIEGSSGWDSIIYQSSDSSSPAADPGQAQIGQVGNESDSDSNSNPADDTADVTNQSPAEPEPESAGGDEDENEDATEKSPPSEITEPTKQEEIRGQVIHRGDSAFKLVTEDDTKYQINTPDGNNINLGETLVVRGTPSGPSEMTALEIL